MSLADAIRATAARIGANPLDLGTVASYESGLRPTARGGAGNRYVGMFQFGPWEQQHYGVTQQTPAEEQVAKAGQFLVDRGFKPGMGLMDMYSAINAGHVGRNNASDAGNGGAPGTVADKVNFQMEGHKAKAAALLGALGGDPATPAAGLQGQTPQAGSTLADALPGATLPTLAAVPVPVPVQTGPDPVQQAQQEQQARQQQVQADQQRKQALLSVSAFYR